METSRIICINFLRPSSPHSGVFSANLSLSSPSHLTRPRHSHRLNYVTRKKFTILPYEWSVHWWLSSRNSEWRAISFSDHLTRSISMSLPRKKRVCVDKFPHLLFFCRTNIECQKWEKSERAQAIDSLSSCLPQLYDPPCAFWNDRLRVTCSRHQTRLQVSLFSW